MQDGIRRRARSLGGVQYENPDHKYLSLGLVDVPSINQDTFSGGVLTADDLRALGVVVASMVFPSSGDLLLSPTTWLWLDF